MIARRGCPECGRPVRARLSDARIVWHRAVRGRKWCLASPGYEPANAARKAQHYDLKGTL